MGGNEERSSLASLYREPYDFSMSVHDDMDTFMNLKEFAAIHEIDGQNIPCVVTLMGVNSSQQDTIYTRTLVLLIKHEYVKNAYSGMTVRLDGKNYVIVAAKQIQGEIWRIELGVSDG